MRKNELGAPSFRKVNILPITCILYDFQYMYDPTPARVPVHILLQIANYNATRFQNSNAVPVTLGGC